MARAPRAQSAIAECSNHRMIASRRRLAGSSAAVLYEGGCT